MLYENPMPKEQYTEYIHSAEWKAKRRERLEMDKGVCQRCGSPDGNVVHHLTYANIGNEKMEDLVTLCSWCHKRIHGIAKIISKKEYRPVESGSLRLDGWVAMRGGNLSIEEMWDITRMPPENELAYRHSRELCESLDREMAGAGRALDCLANCADGQFEACISSIPTPRRKKKPMYDVDAVLNFLESKKLIFRHGNKVMVHPYLNCFERNEVSELCYYNKFCDLWESLHEKPEDSE